MGQHNFNNKPHHNWLASLAFISLTLPALANSAECKFEVVNEWQNGFTGEVTIHNDGDSQINGWQVQLGFHQGESINSAWRAKLTGTNPYQLKNHDWNGKIDVGASKSFGFNGVKSNGEPVSQPTLSGICAASSNDDTDSISVAISASSLQSTAPANIDFSSEVNNAESSNLTYNWQFGDGTESSEASPTHSYQQAGTYQVRLTVSDQDDEYSSEQLTISITEPEPEFAQCDYQVEQEWNSGFRGKVTITNTENVAINGWKVLMAFADNTKLTGVWHANHSGNNPYDIVNENYNKTIRPGQTLDFGFNAQKASENDAPTTPSLGGLCSLDGSINHAPSAVATASVTSGDYPLTVVFDGSESTDLDNDQLTFNWDFGDGNVSTEQQVTYVYQEQGAFQAKLTVSDGVLSRVSETITIQVTEPETPPVVKPFILDSDNSSLYFVSTKKQHVVETHTFTSLEGNISIEGEVSLSIDLNSVETGVDTRDERMREHLFVTSVFSEAEVLLLVDYSALTAMPIGDAQTQSVTAMLNLNGIVAQINADVLVQRLSAEKILVQSVQPILINAADFDFEQGIETLKTLASLSVISYAVPVSFSLMFEVQE